MRVIGTSGHVDHGKSTLVQALSGINPDRLAEEQARKMTIDLGFAWTNLPNGDMLGIVDVPGHRDFIENMLSGVAGIDAALLIIAADEGVMPQTREHLAILDLLGINKVIVALTKIDLIDDPEWLDLIALDIEDLLSTTALQDSPIIPISAITGQGIQNLLDIIQHTLQELPVRVNTGHPRLPIDRAFSVSGFGTIVTGTLAGGSLQVGDNIELQPTAHLGRIRGLQSYKQDVDIASPGSRVAVNIAGINTNQIQRGDVLTHPGQLHPTRLVDVHFNHLNDSNRALKHNDEVKFFSGSSESLANVRLIADELISPGESGWLQIRLRDDLPLSRGERFILRYPSPPQTIGGGIIVNPNPGRRWRRFQKDVIQDLETRFEGSPSERLAQIAQTDAPLKYQNLQQQSDYSPEEFDHALTTALDEGIIVEVGEGLFWATLSFQEAMSSLTTEVSIYHHENPLRLGINRAVLQSKLGMKLNLVDLLVADNELLTTLNQFVKLHDHEILFFDKQQSAIDDLMRRLSQNTSPPAINDLNNIASENVIRALIDLGKLIQINDTIVFSQQTYQGIQSTVLQQIDNDGDIDAKTLRDLLNTSRKYAIAILEHFDSVGITMRVGDSRQRGRNAR